MPPNTPARQDAQAASDVIPWAVMRAWIREHLIATERGLLLVGLAAVGLVTLPVAVAGRSLSGVLLAMAWRSPPPSITGDGGLSALSPREREVLALMAEGRSNAAIAQRLTIGERAVAKHTASIFLGRHLRPSDGGNRRVLAILAYLGS